MKAQNTFSVVCQQFQKECIWKTSNQAGEPVVIGSVVVYYIFNEP
jgi:hypothetical protein